jgi:hypothetical protein
MQLEVDWLCTMQHVCGIRNSLKQTLKVKKSVRTVDVCIKKIG